MQHEQTQDAGSTASNDPEQNGQHSGASSFASNAEQLASSIMRRVFGVLKALDDARWLGLAIDPTSYETAPGDWGDDAQAATAALALSQAWDDLQQELVQLAGVAAQYLGATQALPQDLQAACVQLAAHEVEYERVARAHVDALEQEGALVARWRHLGALSARTKVAVAERLEREKGMSKTAATSAASGDPEYTSLKDEIANALNAKDDAERVTKEAAITAQVAHEKVVSTRMFVEVHMRLGHARARSQGAAIVAGQQPAAASHVTQ